MVGILLSPTAWLGALGIFCLRVSDMTCDTLRMLFVVRGRKGIAWVLGFVQSVIFVIAITTVLQHLDNPLNVIGYAAGFATGNVVGMWIEERLAIGHIKISIVTQHLGAALSESLREAGFAVTEIPARGRDGMVSMLSVSVRRKEVSKVEAIVHENDAEAFVISENVFPLRRGFWRA
jgi:uncharacterized protein YebE (UPF0316 family)